ncbi:chromosome partitioning protein ParA [Fulvimarina sp. 2208YS6-2-32]|uniref:Chromosome partitioning protein ParA n=1 Tax=Fulvimarina uroteuthidis TaxID=3098149 RepID=A0ABU5I4X4_9HYPH|nr:chromosome partitioning protein ParA [Fulvimarina sp. 2208YS6-2-32]MDY8110435.1 chromosome partitioning protein ParA [Fulvimarina sp. 2208YS6-2-32]
MIPVIAIGSLKSSGSTTLGLTLAGVAAAANIPVTIIDGAHDPDAAIWAGKRSLPRRLGVVRETNPSEIETMVRGARRRGEAMIIDCGTNPELLRLAERMADKTLIPVRFSPLSADAAIATDALFDATPGLGRPGRERAFVASAITPIHSRIARVVESLIASSATKRLQVGLSLRAAYEAPFLNGGSLFSLDDDEAPGLDRARAEAAMLAYEVGLLQVAGTRRDAPARLDARIAA